MTPLPLTVRRAIATVAETLHPIAWLVTGSAARALAGFSATPRDLDIEVATDDVAAAARALGAVDGDAIDHRARSRRAQTTLAGVEVDLTAGLTLVGPGGNLPPDFPLMWRFATEARVDGRSVAVAPVEEQIVRILVTGDEARRARFVAEAPPGFVARDDYVSLRLDAARAAR